MLVERFKILLYAPQQRCQIGFSKIFLSSNSEWRRHHFPTKEFILNTLILKSPKIAFSIKAAI